MPLHSAAQAIRQAGRSSGGDFSRALEISRYAREIFTETTWLISVLNLHGEMIDQRDKTAVDDLFKQQVEGFVSLLDHTIGDINEASGDLKSAGVAVHVPPITERLRNIRKVMAGCA